MLNTGNPEPLLPAAKVSMKYRPPTTSSKNVLAGSERDLDRLHALSQEALDEHPAVAQGFEHIKRDLYDATQDARQAVLATAPAGRGDHEPARPESVTFSVVLHVLILCATVFTAAAFSNLKSRSTPVLADDVAWSTGAACVTLVLVLIALFLPVSGSTSTRRQAWKIDLFGVLVVAVGMTVAFSRSGSDTGVAAADWTTWLIATSVVILMLLALTAKTFSSVRSAPVEKPAEVLRDLDRDYVIATLKDKRHAIESVDTLMNQHPQGREAVTRHWQDAVRTAARKGQISKNAAAHARRATAWRWQIELVSEPDYEISQN